MDYFTKKEKKNKSDSHVTFIPKFNIVAICVFAPFGLNESFVINITIVDRVNKYTEY